MRYMAIAILIHSQLLFFSSSTLLAATITLEGDNAIALSGPITAGDSEALRNLLLNDPERFIALTAVHLNSNGGNVEEAIQISKIMDEFKLAAVVHEGSVCASACFAIYASAPSRFPFGDLIIHRPSYNSSVHQEASTEYMQSLQKEAIRNLSEFLEDKFVPRYLIGHLVNTPSNSAYILTQEDLDNLGYFFPPWEELLIAGACKSAPSHGSSDKSRIEAISRCSRNAGQIARYEYLRQHISPEVGREALRAYLISIGASETTSGRMTIEPESKPADENEKAAASQPELPQGKEEPTTESERTSVTDAEALDMFSLKQLQAGRVRALEDGASGSVKRFDRLIEQKKQRQEDEYAWNTFSSRAKKKNIQFEDPGKYPERNFELLIEILPKLASRGDPDAAYRLAVTYYKLGEIETSTGYAKLAAELGSDDALMFLGMVYQTEGSETRDLPRALAYYNLALEHGDAQIRESWVKQRRDELESDLSEDELRHSSQLKSLIESKLPAKG
mgnify:CR=1 FL=1